MKNNIKEIFSLITIPLFFIAIALSLSLVWRLFDLPTEESLKVMVKEYFNMYGLVTIFLSGILEGMLLVGQYFPGSFIIFFGVLSVGKDLVMATAVVVVVMISFFVAHSINYCLGRYGWYHILVKFGLTQSIQKTKEKLLKKGLTIILFSYWLPSLASLTSTSAGILKIPYAEFAKYSLMGIIFWCSFWGILVYVSGDQILKLASLKGLLLIAGIWIAILLVKQYFLQIRKKPKGLRGS